MDLDEEELVIPDSSNLSSSWWSRVAEEDQPALPFDSTEGGLWSGSFVPPPPRPIFIDDNIATDGLTTCDLCTWAWKNSNTFTLDATMVPGELGWVLTMVIVSLISAVIGAIVMIIVIHCRSRMKNTGLNATDDTVLSQTSQIRTPSDKLPQGPYVNSINDTNNGVWSWLSRRSTSIPPQRNLAPVENHYTHMEEPYGGSTGEALYAELDRESSLDRAYQNSAYTDPDAHPSSPPSSAYYSDLSVNTTAPDRAYEVVGLATLPIYDATTDGANRRPVIGRLAAISETVSVPSDYV